MGNKVRTTRKGVVLMVVLFVIMILAVLSVGFLSQRDIELSSGNNMALRAQMDYLAESGIEHADQILSNPDDAVFSGSYWTGATGQQLTSGNDYYDVSIAADGSGYNVTSLGYRLENGQKIAQSSLTAKLSLIANNHFAFYALNGGTIPSEFTISGNVHCDNDLNIQGTVIGDAYSKGSITGNPSGASYPNISSALVEWPGLLTDDYSPQYYFNGGGPYSAVSLSINVQNTTLSPDASNPAGIFYRSGNLNLKGNVVVNGTVIVSGDFKQYSGTNTITAQDNFPAVVVANEFEMKDGQLNVQGFVQVGGRINIDMNANNPSMNIVGGFYWQDGTIYNNKNNAYSVAITSSSDDTVIWKWTSPTNSSRWSGSSGETITLTGVRRN